jgi:hypothetical protein
MRKLLTLAALAALIVMTGCTKQSSVNSPHYSKTAEDAIQRAFDLCRTGNYSEAVRLFVNGPELLKSMPDAAKQKIDRACTSLGQMAVRYEIGSKSERGEGAEIRVRLSQYAKDDPNAKWEAWVWDVSLIKRADGWLIAEAV